PSDVVVSRRTAPLRRPTPYGHVPSWSFQDGRFPYAVRRLPHAVRGCRTSSEGSPTPSDVVASRPSRHVLDDRVPLLVPLVEVGDPQLPELVQVLDVGARFFQGEQRP